MSTSEITTTPSQATGFTGFLSWVMGRGFVDRVTGIPGWVLSAVLLVPRIWLAIPFFNAGWTRVESWGSQEWLFNNIHPVPGLPGSVAAPVTTAAELVLPVLLVLGLFGRLAGLGLAVMAATIYFVVGQTEAGIQNGIAQAAEQIPWLIVGLLVFITGPGRISLDYLIRKRVLGE